MSSRWNSETVRCTRSSAASSTARVVLPDPDRPSTAIRTGLAGIEFPAHELDDALQCGVDHLPAGLEVGGLAEPRIVDPLLRRTEMADGRVEGAPQHDLVPRRLVRCTVAQLVVVVHVQGQDQVALVVPGRLELAGPVVQRVEAGLLQALACPLV